MNYIEQKGPHIKTKLNTSHMMRNLIIALIPIILFSFYKNGLKPFLDGNYTFYGMIYPILTILVGILTGIIIELIYAFIFKRKNIFNYIKHSYGALPGLFIALVAPLNTPLYLIVLASFIGTITKLIFGGFGRNIFNPALIGYIVIFLFFGSVIASSGGVYNINELDATSKTTPLSYLADKDYLITNSDITNNYSYTNLFLGFYPGSPGEVSTVLILFGLIFLIITKTIKWRIPIYYLLTVFVMTLIIGLLNDLGIYYPLFQIITGGLLFGAVFMATDPVTSPVTKTGQRLFALFLGILTVSIRFLFIYPEGVMISILIMNIFVIFLDKIGIEKHLFKILSIIITIILIFTMSFYIAWKVKLTTEEINPSIDKTFTINKVTIDGNKTIYDVTVKAFYEIVAKITIENKKIINIIIINQHETYWDLIEDNDYIEKLISNQETLNDLDTITTATKTSRGLKEMTEKTLFYHNDKEK